jgi:hypothetical protein
LPVAPMDRHQPGVNEPVALVHGVLAGAYRPPSPRLRRRAARCQARKVLRRCRQMHAEHADGTRATASALRPGILSGGFCREPACQSPAHPRVPRPSACICVKPFLLGCPPRRSCGGKIARSGREHAARQPQLNWGAVCGPQESKKFQPQMHTDAHGWNLGRRRGAARQVAMRSAMHARDELRIHRRASVCICG